MSTVFLPMASTSTLQFADPSSSSAPPCTWDVFLSFYGKDTRRNFTSHLYSALLHAGLLTFMDEPELEKGEEISRGLLDAIHDSKIFIVVISENYASSRWCLNELVEILTCKRTNGHVVIPVFYYVDPSELRHHKGSFGHALDFHKKRYSVDIIEKWKSALAEIAELSGYHLKTDANENESYTIQKIVENVVPLISTKNLHLEDYLVGIDSSVEEIYKKLRMESNDVRAIGICGMGGIGKTTAAKTFYNKYFNIFDISCFVDDVKQHSQEGSYLLPLLQQLSVELCGKMNYKVTDVKSGLRQLKQFLCTKKALIVLDDLDKSSYSELLIKVCNFVVAGSRIIFTTRDANLVNQLKEDISQVDIYMMRKLDQVDSLELFSYHAFRKPTPPESFKELSMSFITYAGGLPLALKVLGSSLLSRTDVSFWKDKLEKVREIGENDIQQILRMSYDELGDETQKAIFLDIAFFFVRRGKDEAVHIFKSCGFFPDAGIPVLVERCLLTITKDNMFQMHNLIQDMGNEVIREESEHGNCRRLYLGQGNACMALHKLEETEKLEGLIIDQTISSKSHFSAKVWEKMTKLRLLKIIGGLEIGGNFKNSFHELRCMCWDYCHWTHLPSSFRPQKLVSLEMQNSKLKTLWKGVTPSVNLKTINLTYSRNLKIMPDLSNLTSVDKLVLIGCKSLQKVHPSIGQLTDLSHLDLRQCRSLKELPETIGQLINLNHLDLGYCVNLKRLPETIKQLTALGSLNFGGCQYLTQLPEQLGDMKCLKMLDASHTSIDKLPDSISHLKELVDLKLCGCKKLRKLPVQIGNMESLKLFDARSTAIEYLPDTFVDLVNLDKLQLAGCKNLTSLPKSFWKLKVLRVLDLNRSPKLEQLPEQLGKMQCLEKLYASETAIEELPKSVGLLSRLEGLHLHGCKKIKNFPSSIWNLTSLKGLSLHQQNTDKIILPDIVKDMKLQNLLLSCNLWLPAIRSFSSLVTLELWYESQIFSSDELYSLSKLSNLQDLRLQNCTSRECSFSEFPVNLRNLLIINTTVETLPELSSLKQLKELYIQSGINLQSIPPLPPHLEKISLYDCKSLQDIPDLSMLKELEHLTLSCGNSLKSSSLKQSFLQVGQHNLHIFEADIPDREVAEWFSYKSSGNKLSFTIPPNLGDNFFGLGLWIVYKCKYTDGCIIRLRAVITNETKNIKEEEDCCLPFDTGVGEVLSRVECMKYNGMRSGDRIKISFQSCPVHTSPDGPLNYGRGEVQVKMCGAHLIPNNLVKNCDFGWFRVFYGNFYLEGNKVIGAPLV